MTKDYIRAGLSIVAKSAKAIIASLDDDGFPNLKAMYKPRESDGLSLLFYYEYIVPEGKTIQQKPEGFYLLLRQPVFQRSYAARHHGSVTGSAHQKPHLAGWRYDVLFTRFY